MALRFSDTFCAGNEEYSFEILPPRYGSQPLQLLDHQRMRLEDRYHRTVTITRSRDSRRWTGASDVKCQYMNDLPLYVRRWLEESFGKWDPETIPEGFDIPQGEAPGEPAAHHCPVFPPVDAEPADHREPAGAVETASEDSFPASDPPAWTGTRVS